MTSIKKVGVVGIGTMGQGIAVMLAEKGLETLVVDKTPEKLEQSLKMIEMSLDKRMEKWALTSAEKRLILSRIHPQDRLEGVAQCDLVIEAIKEDLEAKKELFAALGEVCGAETILATNTSALSVTELAGAAKSPQRVIGLHFIHPVPSIGMIEIIRGLQTSDETFARTKRFVEESLDKKGILVYESPGFVTTRLICTLINEAVHVLSEGVASAEDLDEVKRLRN